MAGRICHGRQITNVVARAGWTARATREIGRCVVLERRGIDDIRARAIDRMQQSDYASACCVGGSAIGVGPRAYAVIESGPRLGPARDAARGVVVVVGHRTLERLRTVVWLRIDPPRRN